MQIPAIISDIANSSLMIGSFLPLYQLHQSDSLH
jgi:hypothetical protein